MRIVSKKNIGRLPVYDLTIDDKAQYALGNGVVTHNTAVTYASNQIFVITKAQEKDGSDLAGWKFTINIHKSRFVREKSKLPFTVMYEGGISKWSGLMDIALESGHVIKPKNGWYAWVNLDTGEVSEKNVRMADTNNKEFWSKIINQESFRDYIYNRYNMASSSILNKEEDEEEVEELLQEVGDDD